MCFILVVVLWVKLVVFGLRKGGGLVGPQHSMSKNEDHEFSRHLFMNEVSKI